MLTGRLLVRRTILLSMATLAFSATLPTTPARAADMTVVLEDDSAIYLDFVAHLRSANAAALRLTQSRIDTVGLAQLGTLADDADKEPVTAGIRTRGMRRTPELDDRRSPRSNTGVLVAVGARAARAVVERPGHEPILLALLGRIDFESLRALPQLRSNERAVGVLLLDPTPALQFALIDALLPDARRVGIVSAPDAELLLRALQTTATRAQRRRPWVINAARAPASQDLATALQTVLPISDLLLILPDPVGATPTASLALLQAAAGAKLPAFAASEAMVRAGALAALVPGNAQLAQQAHALGQRLLHASPGPPIVETPSRFEVRTNQHVARRLGLVLPSDADIAARLAAPE